MIKRLILGFKILTVTVMMASCGGTARQAAATAHQEPLRLAEFSADSAYRMIARQVAFGPRVPGSEAHRQCGDFLSETLMAYGSDTIITQQATLRNHLGQPMTMRNILARYNTSAPRHILLAAHWDTRPWADNDPDDANHNRPLPGANDGASGVGVLLEIARLIGEKTPAVGVDILLIDCEDSGVADDDDSWGLGAQYFAKNLPYSPSDTPSYGILLDMVGDPNARFRREYVSELMARGVNDRIQAVAQASGFGDIFINELGGAVTDDHTFLNRAGIPTADIVDCTNAITGNFPQSWHTMADDMPSISKSTLNAVGQTVTNIVYSER